MSTDTTPAFSSIHFTTHKQHTANPGSFPSVPTRKNCTESVRLTEMARSLRSPCFSTFSSKIENRRMHREEDQKKRTHFSTLYRNKTSKSDAEQLTALLSNPRVAPDNPMCLLFKDLFLVSHVFVQELLYRETFRFQASLKWVPKTPAICNKLDDSFSSMVLIKTAIHVPKT